MICLNHQFPSPSLFTLKRPCCVTRSLKQAHVAHMTHDTWDVSLKAFRLG